MAFSGVSALDIESVGHPIAEKLGGVIFEHQF